MTVDRYLETNEALLIKLCREQHLSQEDTEDLAGNVRVAVLTRFSGFDPDKGSFGTWLGAIVRNEALSMRRKEDRQPHCVPSSALTEFLIESTIDGAAGAAFDDIGVDCTSEVDALPVALRRAFTLVVLQEMSTTQAAAEMGVTEGSIRTYVYNARQILRANRAA